MLNSMNRRSLCSIGGQRLPCAMQHLPCTRAPPSQRSRCRAAVASGNKMQGSLGGWRADHLEQHVQPVQALATPVPPVLIQEDGEDVLIQKRMELAKSLKSATQHSQNSHDTNGRSSQVLQPEQELSSAEIADMWDFIITTRTAGMLAGLPEASSNASTLATPTASETITVPDSLTLTQTAAQPKAPAKPLLSEPLLSKPLLSEADAAMAHPVSACMTAGLQLPALGLFEVDTQQPELTSITFPRVPVVRLTIASAPSSKPPQTLLVLDPLSAPCMIVESDEHSKSHQAGALTYNEEYNKAWEAAAWAEYEAEVARKAAEAVDSSEDEGYMGTNDVGSEDEEPDRCQSARDDASSSGSSGGNNSQGSAMIDVKVLCKTQLGERVWLVGEGQQLGNWRPEGALKLKWHEGHYWEGQFAVPTGSQVTYKAVMQTADNRWRWEGGCNHQLLVSHDESVTIVFQ